MALRFASRDVWTGHNWTLGCIMLTPYASAALYVRASTEHQNYSTAHQESALREYAVQHELEVVAVYRDQGRSGLTLDGREGLLQLLADIQSGQASFNYVLVYDVSRWGRFQDVDESAYYEYACRRSGISVAYCAESFIDDGSPLAAVLKGLKRAMAAEYSRELSGKVFRAQCRLTMEGFKQGGTAGYGLRRVVVSATGQLKSVLQRGERKSLPTDRVTFMKGPQAEVDVVRRIYSMYIDELLPDLHIAHRLNAEGIRNESGGLWSNFHVKGILTNEKYAGTIVFNRSTQKLRSSRRPNDGEKWVKLRGGFEGIVSLERFEQARDERRRRRKYWTNEEMLDGLRDLLVEHGRVDADLIDSSSLPAAKTYAARFRGLVAAFSAAGVQGSQFSRRTLTGFYLRSVTKDALHAVERCAVRAGASVECMTPRTYRLNGVVVRVLCTRCRHDRSHPSWKVTLSNSPPVDFVLWVRMDEQNRDVGGQYLIPTSHFPEHRYLWPSTRTLQRYDQYAFASIEDMFGLN
jgi:DNA invertase Pin-like site-specific DNA recombinase